VVLGGASDTAVVVAAGRVAGGDPEEEDGEDGGARRGAGGGTAGDQGEDQEDEEDDIEIASVLGEGEEVRWNCLCVRSWRIIKARRIWINNAIRTRVRLSQLRIRPLLSVPRLPLQPKLGLLTRRLVVRSALPQSAISRLRTSNASVRVSVAGHPVGHVLKRLPSPVPAIPLALAVSLIAIPLALAVSLIAISLALTLARSLLTCGVVVPFLEAELVLGGGVGRHRLAPLLALVSALLVVVCHSSK
jgi:hypothetical protein